MAAPRVTVVVVTWNGAHLLRPCLDSLARQTIAHRVLVVDNASADETPAVLADYPHVRVLRLDTNTGFAGGAQAGLQQTTTPYVAFLNNDAEAEPRWLAELLRPLDADPQVAATTSRILLTADGRINNAGGGLTRWAVGYDRGFGEPDGPPFDVETEVALFCGGACALRTATARKLGGFPPEYFLYYEDTDLAWRLRLAGHRIRYAPTSVVRHLHAASSDRSSALFAYYNQRNQLLTVTRNAPVGLALAVVARFTGITALRLVRPGAGHHQRVRHRLRVLAGYARALPGSVADRRHFASRARVGRSDRRAFTRRWLGS